MRTFGTPTARRTTRRLALTGALATAALLLAACGGSGASGDSTSGTEHGSQASATPSAGASATPSASASAGAFNDADVMFAQMMIPHHEQALEMAELADGRAADPEIKRLVAAIEKAQDPEIRKMRSWLKAWGRPESAGHGGHGMPGMMSDTEMKDLAARKGKAFDRRFAELMIAHHEGAVAMARTEQKDGADGAAKQVADDVVRTQDAEIAQLRKILDRL
ncbi:DUF305 domain-containing protein [Streptomyces sp. NPDC058084]|uniref:DUF305 domain-containing protein n=1 Tax=Streptomyces sp. NPDC058084 TaxID=3346333 RepID=UPI0036E1C712